MLVPGKNLTAADLGEADKNSENAALKPAVLDETTGTVVVPHGSLGFRYGEDGVGKWNLDLGDLLPALSVQGAEATNGDRRTALVHLPSFDTVNGEGATVARGVPVRRVGKHLVCTVFDLMLAHYGVARAACPANGPPATTIPPNPTPRPGRSRSPGCRPPRPFGSPANSPAAQRNPAAAR
ncbi:respiratory nitrate reductase, alpha subunit domain protein [Mycobacterium kansasii 824]|nr:respiratory nitrate reductase, alpha subunit domain protein [Mycobacterium kansasii 824]